MSDYWANLATTDGPNGPSLPDWSEDDGTEPALVLARLGLPPETLGPPHATLAPIAGASW
jgi:hypothetical protein